MHFDVDSDAMEVQKKKKYFFLYIAWILFVILRQTIHIKVVSSLKLMYVSPIIFDFESITKRTNLFLIV